MLMRSVDAGLSEAEQFRGSSVKVVPKERYPLDRPPGLRPTMPRPLPAGGRVARAATVH